MLFNVGQDGILRPDSIRPVPVFIPFCGAKRDGCNPGTPIANRPQDAILPHITPTIPLSCRSPLFAGSFPAFADKLATTVPPCL